MTATQVSHRALKIMLRLPICRFKLLPLKAAAAAAAQ
jgi:hypothetical protein